MQQRLCASARSWSFVAAEVEHAAGSAPSQDQTHARALVLDFPSHHARMVLDFADRTSAVFDQWRDPSFARTAFAVVIIATNLSPIPRPHPHSDASFRTVESRRTMTVARCKNGCSMANDEEIDEYLEFLKHVGTGARLTEEQWLFHFDHQNRDAQDGAAVGESAPDFALPDQSGFVRTRDELMGE